MKFWKEDGQEEAPPVFVGIILPKNQAMYLGSELQGYVMWKSLYNCFM